MTENKPNFNHFCFRQTRKLRKLIYGSTGADFTKGLSPVSDSNLRLLSQIIGILYLSPWAQPKGISQKVSVSALAEPLAQMLRLVESGLKICKQRLKYDRHNSFFTSKFEMAENRVQVYKTTP